jgi:hypothetical protein
VSVSEKDLAALGMNLAALLRLFNQDQAEKAYHILRAVWREHVRSNRTLGIERCARCGRHRDSDYFRYLGGFTMRGKPRRSAESKVARHALAAYLSDQRYEDEAKAIRQTLSPVARKASRHRLHQVAR